jgi:thiol-disulfide isomerase/thioredoxin
MAPAAAFLSACAAGSIPRAPFLIPRPLLLPIPLSPARWDRSRSCSLVGVGANTRRAPTLRRNASTETVVPYVPGSGKYIAPDYLVVRSTVHWIANLSAPRQSVSSSLSGALHYSWLQKKVSAEEVQELVRGQRKVPLIVDFYATWCGPCVQMAQDIEMVSHPPCQFSIIWFACVTVDILANTMPVCEVAINGTSGINEFYVPRQ